MNARPYTSPLTTRLVIYFAICCLIPMMTAHAATVLQRESTPTKTRSVAYDLDDIWFYDDQMQRVVPAVDPEWITVAFSDRLAPETFSGVQKKGESSVEQAARTLVRTRTDLADWFYDENLLEQACFLRLRPGTTLGKLAGILAELDRHPHIRYTHPVIRLDGRRYLFDDTIEITWKTGVSDAVQHRVLAQAHVATGPGPDRYRVDTAAIPLFKALNLIAEDIHVAGAAPHLTELIPTIGADLSFPLNGGNVGDMLPFVLTVRFSHRVRIDPSTIASLDLRPPGVQKELYELHMDPYDYVATANKSPIRLTGWMKIYTTGTFSIPPVEIRYTCEACADPKVRVTRSPAVPVRIASIVPPGLENQDVIIPMAAMTPEAPAGDRYRVSARWHLIMGILGFSVAAGCLAWAYGIRRRTEKQNTNLPVTSRLQIMTARLNSLLNQAPAIPHWSHVADLGRDFRAYLAAAYHVSGPTGGSGMVFFKNIETGLPPELGPTVLQILTQMDDILAEEKNHCLEMGAVIAHIREVVDFRKEAGDLSGSQTP